MEWFFLTLMVMLLVVAIKYCMQGVMDLLKQPLAIKAMLHQEISISEILTEQMEQSIFTDLISALQLP